ncbi:response regulator transcription factor [Herbiconiux sp. 11R-BC]|uniref:response regulator transcription factor n=1 Tax=Herbiconiux sp. 11R-BC TaxID=3111637 RepID=UPI003BFFC832
MSAARASAAGGAELAAEDRRIRVVVVDDQELFVYGLRMLIDSQRDLDLVGTAGDGAAAVDLVRRTRPDVVLMDIRMPGTNGIEATRLIVGERDPDAAGAGAGAGAGADGVGGDPSAAPAPQVVVLTTFQQEEAVFQAMRHGASAFVTKDVTPEVLLDTIRAVHAGDAPPVPVGTVVREFARPAGGADVPDALAALSPRERDVFLLAATGMRNSEIARAAFVSEATVKSHVRAVLHKLGLQSRAQIVVHAYENRLLRR